MSAWQHKVLVAVNSTLCGSVRSTESTPGGNRGGADEDEAKMILLSNTHVILCSQPTSNPWPNLLLLIVGFPEASEFTASHKHGGNLRERTGLEGR
ncbi:hypothetical protein OE88DRAFT_1650984 [Heliocybe sulcata]|uniref:Uncharacterized protein n=1 Tax=Heliocybe sulcata TaxID=5364 RepID=A0A5C3NU85_9AGAM|nr:hypothetical protein OE88DRAFT_1650984 [Heliocybe sulcata]